jgi:hypothetical protein
LKEKMKHVGEEEEEEDEEEDKYYKYYRPGADYVAPGNKRRRERRREGGRHREKIRVGEREEKRAKDREGGQFGYSWYGKKPEWGNEEWRDGEV